LAAAIRPDFTVSAVIDRAYRGRFSGGLAVEAFELFNRTDFFFELPFAKVMASWASQERVILIKDQFRAATLRRIERQFSRKFGGFHSRPPLSNA
jgi:hypothetical protein